MDKSRFCIQLSASPNTYNLYLNQLHAKVLKVKLLKEDKKE